MFTLIFVKENILNCGSKPDEIGFQNAETKPHIALDFYTMKIDFSVKK